MSRKAPLVIITCGHRKLAQSAQARLMYTGPYAVACRDYGEQLARQLAGDSVILSAKYGFVAPTKVIEPYNVTMGDADAITLEQLHDQAEQLGFNRDVIVVGGAKYFNVVAQLWPEAKRAIEETRGIGYQRAWLARAIRAGA